MQQSAQFVTTDDRLRRQLRAVLLCLPPLRGGPISIERAPALSDRRGAVHAGAFLRERRIALACPGVELPRILVHELFHFVWLRAGNANRLSFERLLGDEYRAGARGELGWSAEWRKTALRAADLGARSRPWREYCCEGFCDTAAWLYCGRARHPEFTLAGRFRRARRLWFENFVNGGLSI